METKRIIHPDALQLGIDCIKSTLIGELASAEEYAEHHGGRQDEHHMGYLAGMRSVLFYLGMEEEVQLLDEVTDAIINGNYDYKVF